jgi:hypothetical protein
MWTHQPSQTLGSFDVTYFQYRFIFVLRRFNKYYRLQNIDALGFGQIKDTFELGH